MNENFNNLRIKLLVLAMLLANMVSAQNVVVKPDYDKALVCIEVDFPEADKECFFQADVSFEGENVVSGTALCGRPLTLAMPEDFLRWTPYHPFLYDLKINVLKDNDLISETETQFAMRRYGVWRDENGVNRLTLNHLPIFLFGTQWTCELDTMSSQQTLDAEVLCVKELGFNMIRMNNPIESSHFLHLCDSIGLIVWHDGESEVAHCMAQLPTATLCLPLGNDMEAYEKCANRLYLWAFDGISAAVLTPTYGSSFKNLDSKRLLQVNRRISHAFDE